MWRDFSVTLGASTSSDSAVWNTKGQLFKRSLASARASFICFFLKRQLNCHIGAIHSTKIPTGPTEKSVPPQKVDLVFRNFSGWTEQIH